MNIQAIADHLNEPITRKRAIAAIVIQGVVSYTGMRLAFNSVLKNAESIINEQNQKMVAAGELLEFAVENLDDAALSELDEKAHYWNIVLPKGEK